MADEDLYPGAIKNQHNTDLVSGQHQVFRVSGAGGQRYTSTTVFDHSQNQFVSNEHQTSNATINANQAANMPMSAG